MTNVNGSARAAWVIFPSTLSHYSNHHSFGIYSSQWPDPSLLIPPAFPMGVCSQNALPSVLGMLVSTLFCVLATGTPASVLLWNLPSVQHQTPTRKVLLHSFAFLLASVAKPPAHLFLPWCLLPIIQCMLFYSCITIKTHDHASHSPHCIWSHIFSNFIFACLQPVAFVTMLFALLRPGPHIIGSDNPVSPSSHW